MRFKEGDYVYYRTTEKIKKADLVMEAQPVILRVKEVRPSNVLLLQGRCGSTIAMHSVHCTPATYPSYPSPLTPVWRVHSSP
jgi:hypothetical protein